MSHIGIPFSIFILISWLLSSVFFFMNRPLTFLQNLSLYMIVAIGLRNYFTILSLRLKLVDLTHKQALFIDFLVMRELIIPIVLLLFVNIYWRVERQWSKIMVTLCALGLMTVLDVLLNVFDIVSYTHWNYVYESFVNLLLLVSTLLLARFILYISSREHPNHGYI